MHQLIRRWRLGRRLGPPILVALILAARAASAEPVAPTPAEEQSLEELRDFAEAAARHYRMLTPVEVAVASWLGSPALPQYARTSALYNRGTLYVSRAFLSAPYRAPVLAKALAHEMGRAPSRAATLADRERERAEQDGDANARAVEILVQVGGAGEAEALEQVYGWLLGIHRARSEEGPSACDAILRLLSRFPAHRERFAGRECAPA